MTGQEFLKQLDGYFRKGEMEAAQDFLQKTYAEAVGEGDVSLQLTVLNEMMSYAGGTDQEEFGIAAVTECTRLIQEYGLQDNPSAGTMWMNMGITLYRFDRVEDALACYRVAEEQLLKQYEKLDALPDSTENGQALGDVVRELASFYSKVASAYAKKKDYKEAEQYYKKAEQLIVLQDY